MAIGVSMIAALAFGLLGFEFWRSRHPGFLQTGVPECRAAYARARTAADTASADETHPTAGPQRDPNDPTCGTLRAARELGQ
jgi:hypothetical protein